MLVDFVERFVDEFSPQHKVMDPFDFLKRLQDPSFGDEIEVILHQGACSSTTIYDPNYMMKHNFDYSHDLFHACLKYQIRLIYASSASVYGDGPFIETATVQPKNIYAKSKSLFDEYVSLFLNEDIPQVVGLRYFNVYGPWEFRKDKMSSVMCQFKRQIDQNKEIKIFEGSRDYLRDFISVEDIVSINEHFVDNPQIKGIYNCGTGFARSFAEIPQIMLNYYDFDIKEIAMPNTLVEKYQSYTRAQTDKLRNEAKYEKPFLSLEGGIKKYVDFWER